MEIWRDIKGYEGYYQISNLGRVKSLSRKAMRSNGREYTVQERILKQYELRFKGNKKPRKMVHLRSGNSNRFLVHRLVAQAFIANPNKLPQVNHLDGNPDNNGADNLEWSTNQENIAHAYKTGLMSTERKVVKVCPDTNEKLKTYKSGSEAGRAYQVTPGAIFHAINNSWKAGGYYWEYAD